MAVATATDRLEHKIKKPGYKTMTVSRLAVKKARIHLLRPTAARSLIIGGEGSPTAVAAAGKGVRTGRRRPCPAKPARKQRACRRATRTGPW